MKEGRKEGKTKINKRERSQGEKRRKEEEGRGGEGR